MSLFFLLISFILQLLYGITGSTVVLTCCKGDCESQWKTPIFRPSGLGHLTNFYTNKQ